MRILVIRPGAMGDALLTLPALDALQSGFPQARIEAMGNVDVLQLLLGRSPVCAVSCFDRADLALLFQPDAFPPASLKGYLDAFDLVLSYATRPQHVFAASLARSARGRVLSFDPRPPPGSRMHLSDYLQLPLRELGIAPSLEAPRLRLSVADGEAAGQWWSAPALATQRAVAIHPGSGSPAKNWPAARFAVVARWLVQQHQMRVVLIAGPADEDAVGALRRNLGEDEYLLAEGLPLPLLAGVLARCALYLGSDSGVSHLAAALGTPSVAVFGPTHPELWAPRGRCVRIVHTSAACAPCDDAVRRDCAHRICLDSVSVAEVLQQIDITCANGQP